MATLLLTKTLGTSAGGYIDQLIDVDTSGRAPYDQMLFNGTTWTSQPYQHYPHQNTGILVGGEIHLEGSPQTAVHIHAGKGIIVDWDDDPTNATVTLVEWDDVPYLEIENLTTHDFTYFYIDINGNIQQTTTPLNSPEDHRTKILLGSVATPSRHMITGIMPHVNIAFDWAGRIADLGHALGQFNVSGNIYGPNGHNLKLNKTSGTVYDIGAGFHANINNPDTPIIIAATELSFNYTHREHGDEWEYYPPRYEIDPNHWDAGLTGSPPLGGGSPIGSPPYSDEWLSLVPPGKWTVQHIHMVAQAPLHEGDPLGYFHTTCEYGQTIFDTLDDALSGYLYSRVANNPVLEEESIFRAWLIVKQGATDLSDPEQAIFIQAPKFSGLSGSATNANNVAVVISLQDAYNNSASGQIVTNNSLNAVDLYQGAGAEDSVLRILDTNSILSAYIQGDGFTWIDNNLEVTGNIVVGGTVDGVDVAAHNARHISAGADEVDGDRLDIDWNPTNYTPTTDALFNSVDHLGAHLKGIDTKIGSIDTNIGNIAIADLSDVTMVGSPFPVNHDVIAWDENLNLWVNKHPSEIMGIPLPAPGSYASIQVQTGTIGAVSGTTAIALVDNVAPTIAEGTQIWSASFTPVQSTSLIRALMSAVVAGSVSNMDIIFVLFRNTTAVGFAMTRLSNSNTAYTFTFNVHDAPNTTLPITYSVRCGRVSTGTWYVNTLPGYTNPAGGIISNHAYVIQEYGIVNG